MNTLLSLFVFSMAIVYNIMYSAEGIGPIGPIGDYKDVSHYQYAISWGPTYCKYLKHDQCISDLSEIFYTHGIWAGDARGNTVDNCLDDKGQPKPSLSYDLLKKYEAKLSISWRPIIKGMSNFTFWGHEYRKHGVCFKGWSGSDYLSFTNKVSVNNNITKLLETKGIKKSSTVKYSRDAIEKAIQGKIGAGFNIYLGCEKVETIYFLKTAALCIKKKDNTQYMNVYEFVSCPQNNNPQFNNCGGGKKNEENIILLSRI